MLFDPDLASGEGVARTVNDCCCGTGGRLTLTKDRIQQINPQREIEDFMLTRLLRLTANSSKHFARINQEVRA